MILFFISFLLVFMSSYLVTSILANKNSLNGLIYMFLIPFAQIVLIFEILSLHNFITPIGVLSVNLILFVVSVFAWVKSGSPFWSLDVKPFFKRYRYALKRDKYLAVLSLGFLVFVLSAIFIMSFLPVVNPDASSYHVLRSAVWVANKNLNHFVIADARNLVLPINSEILYAWILLFLKKQAWFGFFSFAGYLLSIISVYGILGLVGFSTRKKLWTVFIISSFASVIVQSSGTETDIILAGLITASIFLYWKALLSDTKIPLFMSSLAYALAIGTKTPALLAIPGVGLGLIALSIYYRKKDFYKPILMFIGFGIINFMLFAAYNYILNLIEYGNLFSSKAFAEAHKNPYGIAAIPVNFVKYVFLMFDFTGFRWAEYFGDKLTALRDSIITFMGLSYVKDGIYSVKTSQFNQSLLEPLMGMGILGFLVFLPAWFYSLIKPLFSRNKKTWFLFGFGVLFLINLIVMSYQLAFMTFSTRFLMFFAVLSAPVITSSYCRKNNPLKFIIVLFAMFYLTLVSTNLWARPLSRILPYFKIGGTVRQIRTISACSGFVRGAEKYPQLLYEYPQYSDECKLRDYILSVGKDKKILLFSNGAQPLLLVQILNLNGYNVDYGLMEDINDIDLSKYDLIGTVDNKQWSTLVRRFDERITDYSVSSQGIRYLRNENNPCFYMDKNGYAIKENNEAYPYSSKCHLENKFFEEHGLVLKDKIETRKGFSAFDKDKKDADKSVTYFFYEKR